MKNKPVKCIKRARRLVKGLTIEWVDDRPDHEGTIDHFHVSVSHKNPVMRPAARDMFREFVDYITIQTPFYWKVNAETIFEYPNGMQQSEQTEIKGFFPLTEVNDLLLAELAEDKRKGAHFKHVHFTVECIDTHATPKAA